MFLSRRLNNSSTGYRARCNYEHILGFHSSLRGDVIYFTLSILFRLPVSYMCTSIWILLPTYLPGRKKQVKKSRDINASLHVDGEKIERNTVKL